MKYYPPEYRKKEFNCAHCGVFARQEWDAELTAALSNGNSGFYANKKLPGFISVSLCAHCKKYTIWVEENMIYPASMTVEDPNVDMPEPAKKLYKESAQILSISPRASAALLRLALQEILNEVVEDGNKNNINTNIGKLAKQVDGSTKKALDIIRVFGNNEAHPGEITIDEEPVKHMYKLLNIVVQKLISDKKKVDELYEDLPDTIKSSIENRDSKEEK